jgi:hypothetical protein
VSSPEFNSYRFYIYAVPVKGGNYHLVGVFHEDGEHFELKKGLENVMDKFITSLR